VGSKKKAKKKAKNGRGIISGVLRYVSEGGRDSRQLEGNVFTPARVFVWRMNCADDAEAKS
jgi:hypothetical protein